MRSAPWKTLCAALAVASPAYAEDPPPEPATDEAPAAAEPAATAPAATAPAAATQERVVLPAHRLFLHAFVELNVASDAFAKPFSITPDVFYGIGETLTVGLIHSSTAATGFIGDVGNSLCLAGAENGCADVYNGLGLDARYELATSATSSIAVNPAVLVNAIDPLQIAIKVGLIGRYRPSSTDKVVVDFAPNVQFGVTEREPEAGAGEVVATNKDLLFVPLTVQYALTDSLAGMIQSGAVVPLADTADLWTIPLALGFTIAVTKQFTLDAAFALPAFLGGEAIVNGFEARTLTVGGGYAF